MADKMMRIAGRSKEGAAKALKTTSEGDLMTQKKGLYNLPFSVTTPQNVPVSNPLDIGEYINVNGYEKLRVTLNTGGGDWQIKCRFANTNFPSGGNMSEKIIGRGHDTKYVVAETPVYGGLVKILIENIGFQSQAVNAVGYYLI